MQHCRTAMQQQAPSAIPYIQPQQHQTLQGLVQWDMVRRQRLRVFKFTPEEVRQKARPDTAVHMRCTKHFHICSPCLQSDAAPISLHVADFKHTHTHVSTSVQQSGAVLERCTGLKVDNTSEEIMKKRKDSQDLAPRTPTCCWHTDLLCNRRHLQPGQRGATPVWMLPRTAR